jgi:hypothetical protein
MSFLLYEFAATAPQITQIGALSILRIERLTTSSLKAMMVLDSIHSKSRAKAKSSNFTSCPTARAAVAT